MHYMWNSVELLENRIQQVVNVVQTLGQPTGLVFFKIVKVDMLRKLNYVKFSIKKKQKQVQQKNQKYGVY